MRHTHGDLCKHLGIDSSTDQDDHLGIDSRTDHPDRYSNLFLNAYINRHAHTEYLKMIEVYSPFGIWHVFLYSINTNIYHLLSMKYRDVMCFFFHFYSSFNRKLCKQTVETLIRCRILWHLIWVCAICLCPT